MKNREFVAAALTALGVLAMTRDARAAGLYISDRGVRPLGRGGAFVAGADDLGAIWYNPAGIVEAPSSVLMDGSLLHYTAHYAARWGSTSATNTLYDTSYPEVKGTTPPLPIPTIAASVRFGKQFALALGVYAPDAPLLDWPANTPSGPAPNRYTLISLNGTLLAVVGAWASYRPIREIEIGVGAQMLTGYLKQTVAFSGCAPDHFFCAPLSSDYDTYALLKGGPIFSPSANAGITFIPAHSVRIGVSGQAPFVINTAATVDTRLPTEGAFANATQNGNTAHLRLELPPILRAGIELRPLDNDDLRIELAYSREFWSVQNSVTVTPDNLHIDNITGFPQHFGVGSISVPRGMQDSNSFHLGGEYKYDLLGMTFVARAGVSYETSAVPPAYVTPFTIDNDKVAVSIGAGVYIVRNLRFDWVVSHTFQGDVIVDPQQAAVPATNPVQGNQLGPGQTATVNGGRYRTDLWVLGAGFEYRF